MKNYVGREHKGKDGTTSVWIYSTKRNKLNYIGTVNFRYGITKGAESEVYNFLIEKKLIPQKAYQFSKQGGNGPGYYIHNNPYCSIQII